MSGGERRSVGTKDHHADRVIRLGEFESRTQFDEHSAVLGVALPRAIEGYHGDTPLVDDVVAHELETPGMAVMAECRRHRGVWRGVVLAQIAGHGRSFLRRGRADL